MRTIGQTIINTADVFVGTEDGERFVTDRYSLWRVADLHHRAYGSELAAAVDHLPDGCYKMTASGAATVNTRYTSVPKMRRLLPDSHGDTLERLPVVLDGTGINKHGVQLWQAPSGHIVGVDARLVFDGYDVCRESRDSDSRVLLVNRTDHEVVGVVMCVRLHELNDIIARLARHTNMRERVTA